MRDNDAMRFWPSQEIAGNTLGIIRAKRLETYENEASQL
jgi:hypothetical protein